MIYIISIVSTMITLPFVFKIVNDYDKLAEKAVKKGLKIEL